MLRKISLAAAIFVGASLMFSCASAGEAEKGLVNCENTDGNGINAPHTEPSPQVDLTTADVTSGTVLEETDKPLDDGDNENLSEKEIGHKVVLLTEPYFDGYELTEALDYDAFLEYLPSYFAEITGEDVFVCITDMIDSGGVVTLLTEYHDIKAVETGRRSCTVRGGGNLFFNYSAETGADFSESLFAGVQRLHDFHAPEQFIDGDYVFIDNHGYVCIHQWDGKIINSPAKYEWGCYGMENIISYACDDNHMSGRDREHYIVAVNTKATSNEGAVERKMMVYTTKDGGVTWSEAELDYTPTTTELVYPVTDISLRSLNSGELDTCSIILGTSRCEVFYYVTCDGGITWERRSNFKLLNYRNSALLSGGMIYEDLALMSFKARDGKNPNVYISRDGGYNWALMDIPTPDGLSEVGAYAVSMYRWNGVAAIEVMYGEEMRSYVSFDHGETWEWES